MNCLDLVVKVLLMAACWLQIVSSSLTKGSGDSIRVFASLQCCYRKLLYVIFFFLVVSVFRILCEVFCFIFLQGSQYVKRLWSCWQTAADSNKHQNPGGLHHVALTLSPLNIMFPIPRRQQLMQARQRVPLSHWRPHMCLLKRLLPLWHVLEILRSSWRGRVINRRRSRACYEMIRLPPLGGPVICWFCPC